MKTILAAMLLLVATMANSQTSTINVETYFTSTDVVYFIPDEIYDVQEIKGSRAFITSTVECNCDASILALLKSSGFFDFKVTQEGDAITIKRAKRFNNTIIIRSEVVEFKVRHIIKVPVTTNYFGRPVY